MSNPKSLRLRRALVAVTLAFIMASFIPARCAQAAAGDLDLTFGVGGKVVTDFFGQDDLGYAIAVQPDGRIIMAGTAIEAGVVFAVVRYETSGNLDASFGSNGKVTAPVSGRVSAVAIQADGKIVVGGSTSQTGSSTDFALVRFNPNGSLDQGFGNGGLATADFSGSFDEINAIAIQPDGKIVAAGLSFTVRDNFVLARFNTDGSLDSGFGNGGEVVTRFASSDEQATAVALQPDGKIVAAGFGIVPSTGLRGFVTARYLSTGDLDPTFGSGGKVITTFIDGTGQAQAVAVEAGGKIVVGGSVFGNLSVDFTLARYDASGNPDPAFGNGGIVRTTFDGAVAVAFALVLQPDGRLLLGGGATAPQDRHLGFALARYNANGTLDASFGIGGKVRTTFFGMGDQVWGLALQPDGRILAAGYAEALNGINFALARYKGDGANGAFDLCLQDDSNGNMLQLNSTTGEYLFTNCGGVSVGGVGVVTRRGNLISLQHNAADRRVMATVDTGVHRASASVQLLALGKTFSITDRNTTNNTCGCK